MRPISLAVDVTNYVMMLLGQPLHAFDLDTLSGSVGTRRARAGEKLTTLDDVERAARPRGPAHRRRRRHPAGHRRRHGRRDVGGHRHDDQRAHRGRPLRPDHGGPVLASPPPHHRGVQAVRARRRPRRDRCRRPARGRPAGRARRRHGRRGRHRRRPPRRRPSRSPSTPTLPTRYIGLDYPRDEVAGHPARHRLRGRRSRRGASGDHVSVLPPSWRPDLTDGPELVEEVARVRGYDQIPSVLPQPKAAGRGLTHGQRIRRVIATTLAHQGLAEVLSYPFVAPSLFDRLGARRPTTSAVHAVAAGQPAVRRGAADADVGARHPARHPAPQRGPRLARRRRLRDRPRHPGAAASPPARRSPASSTGPTTRRWPPSSVRCPRSRATRHTRLRVRLERGGPWGPGRTGRRLATRSRGPWRWAARSGSSSSSARPTARPGTRVAAPSWPCADGTVVGHAGELHPKVTGALELPARTVAGELDVDVLVAATGTPMDATALSTYPLAHTDVALVVDEAVPAAEVEAALRAGAGDEPGVRGAVRRLPRRAGRRRAASRSPTGSPSGPATAPSPPTRSAPCATAPSPRQPRRTGASQR